MHLKSIIPLLFTVLVSLGLQAQKITEGTWYNEEKDGRIQFYESNGKLYGKIAWLKMPEENGKPRTDINNPNNKLKSRPLLGMVFLKDFEETKENFWEDGIIYDPKSGKNYSCEMKLESPDKLHVRGFVGISLLGRTTVFTRAK
ncbi:DUF2147 domain-containing protein [Marinilongibacter aquaticus]|uniref:DUF2147 domain-containing protein n=1 Tax=Marinilongibacter aquaticus TaxID=2975157 RepID=UPI0021BDEF49|nr:DUF2147 domain-containing protein [Marinilongibacter aquaticus]UBM58838.1 DUF2147 domain-containing protein [Marinilongibacter aquaticus]